MSQSAPPPPQPQPQSYPQPQPQPADGNPFAQQQAPSPYAAQPGAVPPPPAPPAPPRGNVAVGLVAAVVAAVPPPSTAWSSASPSTRSAGRRSASASSLGLAAGRLGGRNPMLAVVSTVLALGSVYLGQLVGEAMIGADQLDVSFSELFFQHFGVVQDAWKEESDPLAFLFLAIAGWAAFSGAKKAAA
ncbi:hypothetical protein [Streptomyces sp. NPDC056660]|uniref:hypothetical protein n=1 Tax=Streptomyces sp. NPDC056660 TaxID=3345897 RepID=UPI00368D100B